jgi:hypothetical protein
MVGSARGSSGRARDGEEFPRVRRLMAGDPRAREGEPDHCPEAIPEAISHGSLKGITPSPPCRVLGGFYPLARSIFYSWKEKLRKGNTFSIRTPANVAPSGGHSTNILTIVDDDDLRQRTYGKQV